MRGWGRWAAARLWWGRQPSPASASRPEPAGLRGARVALRAGVHCGDGRPCVQVCGGSLAPREDGASHVGLSAAHRPPLVDGAHRWGGAHLAWLAAPAVAFPPTLSQAGGWLGMWLLGGAAVVDASPRHLLFHILSSTHAILAMPPLSAPRPAPLRFPWWCRVGCCTRARPASIMSSISA